MYRLFEAETIKELMEKVKSELGAGAVILKPKEGSSGGLKGMLGKKVWRVYAYSTPDDLPDASASGSGQPRLITTPANDSLPRAGQTPMNRRPSSNPVRAPHPAKTRVQQPVNHLINEPALPFGDSRMASLPAPQSGLAERRRPAPAPSLAPARPAASTGSAQAGMMEDSAIRTILKEIRAVSEQINSAAALAQSPSECVILPGVLQPFYQRLTMQEVPRELCVELMDQLCDRASLDIHDVAKVTAEMEELIASRIETVAMDKMFSTRRPRILFFVGPAGSGKTTTLAKVATMACRDEKMKIACVTLDTLRVASAELLRTYAHLISAPIEVVMSSNDLASAIVRHADKDLILVDTPGKDPCSPAGLAEFSGYIKQISGVRLPPPAVLPVFAAPTRLSDLDRYANCYRSLQPSGLIFSKLDETRTYGSLLAVMLASKLPAVFMTTGQDVPDQIEPANGRRLARRILGLPPV